MQRKKMQDYAEHLTQLDKLRKQMRQAALKKDWAMAEQLSLMSQTEQRLLTLNFAELKREQESRLS
jgi:hypothetical protein